MPRLPTPRTSVSPASTVLHAIGVILRALALCTVFGLSSGVAETTTPRAFRLGVSCPLSGVLAEYGTAVRNGIELARRERPEDFARIEIILEDSQWDPKIAVSAFRALHDQRKVDLLFNWGNPTSEAVAPLAERARLPTLIMSSDQTVALNARYITRSINSAKDLGAALAQEVRRRGFRRIGVITLENSYIKGMVTSLIANLGTQVAVTELGAVTADIQDFRGTVTKIKAASRGEAGFDALGIFLVSGQLSTFYRQLNAAGITVPTFGADFLDSRSELAAAGPAVEGAFHPNFAVSEEFRGRYQAAFGNDAQLPFAANAYDIARITAHLFGKSDPDRLTPEQIVDAVRGVQSFESASGRISAERSAEGDHFLRYPIILKEARNGSSVTLRPPAPHVTPFKVGALIPTTGPLAEYGTALERAFAVARRTYPEKFRNIEFHLQDSAYNQRTAVSAFQALSMRGDINLYYTWGVSPNESILPIAAARRIPVIAETTFKWAVVGKPLAVRAAPTGEMTATVLGTEILKRGYRSIGVLGVNVPYYNDILAALEKKLSAAGITLETVQLFNPDDTDFRTTITKIRKRRYDALGVFLLNDQVVTFYRQAATLQYTPQTFGAAIHDNQQLITRAGPAAEGAFFVGYDVQPEFEAQWRREFNDTSMIGVSANAFDTAVLIADLYGDGMSATLSAEQIIERLKGISDRRGVSGIFSFAESSDAGKHIDFPLSLRIVQNGEIRSGARTG